MLSVHERTGTPHTYTGRGVVMAFVDSGFFPHVEIAERIRLYVDATTERIREGVLPPSTNPLNWHGQMTSVIAAGDGRLSSGRYRGVAHGAELILVKVSNRRRQIKEADILRGLLWVLRNAHHHDIRVVNVSVGGDAPDTDPRHPLHDAVRRLSDIGVTVLCAAGNRSEMAVLPPASADSAITVGGYDDRNSLERARWTIMGGSFGVSDQGSQKPEVLAPAAWIASPIMPGTDMAREAPWLVEMLKLPHGANAEFRRLARAANSDLHLMEQLMRGGDVSLQTLIQQRIDAHKLIDEAHQHVDGTSVAVAIASSLVAALLEAEPGLMPAQVKARLMASASALPGVSSERQGAGAKDGGKLLSAQ